MEEEGHEEPQSSGAELERMFGHNLSSDMFGARSNRSVAYFLILGSAEICIYLGSILLPGPVEDDGE